MSFFDDLSPLGKILCGAALVAAAATVGTAMGGVGVAEAVKDVRE